MSGSQLPVDPGLVTTLLFKLAVMAASATMLVRYRRFRHILIFGKLHAGSVVRRAFVERVEHNVNQALEKLCDE